MKRDTMPKGFKCECGTEHPFSAYVYAHWDIRLSHTCDECGARHNILGGTATLHKKGTGRAKAA